MNWRIDLVHMAGYGESSCRLIVHTVGVKESIDQSKGVLESGLLAMIFVRPFRCEKCDYRFFRWSITEKSGPARPPDELAMGIARD